MIAMEDKNNAGIPADPWADWKPVWQHPRPRGAVPKPTPHDLQERHAPTEAVEVRISSTRTRQQSRRRILDARLWDSLAPAQQDAAEEILLAYQTMGRGLGFATTNWERIPGAGGAGNVAEAHARLINIYVMWAQRCQKKKICHSMIIDLLAFGLSLRQSDRDRRLRKGVSRRNLVDGLSVYCEIRGWRV